MLAAGMMLITRCCSASTARSAMDWQVLLVIAAALGLGKAIDKSGLDEVLAGVLQSVSGQDPTVTLAVVFGVTMVLASVITAKAAAVLVLPIAAIIPSKRR